jgi:3,8-divinyl chlorophyllide a/chlorophyllide a reductase subunit Y
VPGLRLAARGAAHAPHAHHPVGQACCVYGLTFTSHFYGARRSVGYVPFNSESLVTGKLFEDIREAAAPAGRPGAVRRIVIINLCVPTASGVPLQLLPKQINGVRIIGIDVPGFGVPTHAEAKDVLAGAMLRYARGEAEAGPVTAPRNGVSDKPTSRCWARCSRPTRWASA